MTLCYRIEMSLEDVWRAIAFAAIKKEGIPGNYEPMLTVKGLSEHEDLPGVVLLTNLVVELHDGYVSAVIRRDRRPEALAHRLAADMDLDYLQLDFTGLLEVVNRCLAIGKITVKDLVPPEPVSAESVTVERHQLLADLSTEDLARSKVEER